MRFRVSLPLVEVKSYQLAIIGQTAVSFGVLPRT